MLCTKKYKQIDKTENRLYSGSVITLSIPIQQPSEQRVPMQQKVIGWGLRGVSVVILASIIVTI